MSFGEKLTEYRIRYGMNKKVLAERIGISPDYLRRVTIGECPPSKKIVNGIIEVLRLSQEEAVELREEAKQRVLYGKDGQSFIGKVHTTL